MTLRSRCLVLAAALGLSLALAPAAAAQDPRLEARVDGRTRAQLAPILDSARRAGLPLEPLIDKALEGDSKGAPRQRIVAAVRALAGTLGTARDALGRGASEPEIIAAADAIEAGISPREVGVLRNLLLSRPITVPLAVLADLVARGVPPDTAAYAVLNLARVQAADAQFVGLRIDVERDIGSGIAPATAIAVRSEASVRDVETRRAESRSAVPGQETSPTP